MTIGYRHGENLSKRKPRRNPHYLTKEEVRKLNRNLATKVDGNSNSILSQLPLQSTTGAPRAIGRKFSPEDGMNKGEQKYARHLTELFIAGEIMGWWFEPFNLRLASNTYYRPDFLVMEKDRTLKIVDVKGRRGDSYWCEEDSKVKIKTIARLFPMFAMVVTWQRKNETWAEIRFPSK